MQDKQQKLSAIPCMNIILGYDWLQEWHKKLGRNTVKHIINKVLAGIKAAILDMDAEFSPDVFKSSCFSALYSASRSSLKRVINAMNEIASLYSNLEYDLKAGAIGQRNSHTLEKCLIVMDNNKMHTQILPLRMTRLLTLM